MNTAKAALATCVILDGDKPLGLIPDVQQYMKGLFNVNPPQPKYDRIWDADIVLKWMLQRELPHLSHTVILTQKLALLILLTTGQRPSILTALRLSRMHKTPDTISFDILLSEVKQGRQGYQPPKVVLRTYDDKKLCVVTHLLTYLDRTKSFRGNSDRIFLTTKKPYGEASLNSISRWIKQMLKATGIDVRVFGAGSTRAASTSKAAEQGASLDVIMASAGWTQSSTFAKFYNKPILPAEELGSFILPKK